MTVRAAADPVKRVRSVSPGLAPGSRATRRAYGVGAGSKGCEFKERRVLRYTPEQLYDVVADVDQYPRFVPWCTGCKIRSRSADGCKMDAELEIGFRLLNERYTSHVVMDRPHRVHTSTSASALFDKLDCKWEFSPGPSPGTTTLDFALDFGFSSPLYNSVATVFFDEVVARCARDTRAPAPHTRARSHAARPRC